MSLRSEAASRAHRGTLALLVTVLLPGLMVGACTLTDSGPSEPATQTIRPDSATSRGRVDLSALTLPRTDFCEVLTEDGVTKALDGPVSDTAHYGNGDEVEVSPGNVDVSHEYGCVFVGGDGTTAKAWVFARPVALDEARMLVRRARRGDDCTFPRGDGFGRPGLTSVCEVATGADPAPSVRARLEGLFGDSWLGCEVSEPFDGASGAPAGSQTGARADVVRRAERWCVSVATTLGQAGPSSD